MLFWKRLNKRLQSVSTCSVLGVGSLLNKRAVVWRLEEGEEEGEGGREEEEGEGDIDREGATGGGEEGGGGVRRDWSGGPEWAPK